MQTKIVNEPTIAIILTLTNNQVLDKCSEFEQTDEKWKKIH